MENLQNFALLSNQFQLISKNTNNNIGSKGNEKVNDRESKAWETARAFEKKFVAMIFDQMNEIQQEINEDPDENGLGTSQSLWFEEISSHAGSETNLGLAKQIYAQIMKYQGA